MKALERTAKLLAIKEQCIQHLKTLESWPSYFERRYQEFLTFVELFPEDKPDKILELGCGIGYYSAFLSTLANQVVSTDLEHQDTTTHSLGLQITRNFLKQLNISNVIVQAASAEQLPFDDNSFDMIFSSHVLEHVPDRERAIREINRVLKPGGIHFCLVPTTADRLYAFPLHYIYLLKRTLYHGLIKPFLRYQAVTTAVPAEGHKKAVDIPVSAFKTYLKDFPFPPPHGAFPHYIREVQGWTLFAWKRLLTQHGNISLIRQTAVQLNPALPLLSMFFPVFAVRIYARTRRVENRLGNIPLLRHLGISTVLITRKV